MEGCRYPMPWSRNFKNSENYRLYSKMINLRKENETLRCGSFKFICSEGRITSFARFDENKVFVGIISTEEQDKKISLSLEALGAKSLGKELFETPFCSVKTENGETEITVKAGESYLFECEMK